MDIYSTGLSVIFLVTLDPTTNGPHSLIVERLLESLLARQKSCGGWGYPEMQTGDTSMTQYVVLGYWEATQVGYQVSPESIERVAIWLMKTQDPSGGFGYQGTVSPTFVPVPQTNVYHSLTAAGLGSMYVCADLLGLSALAKEREEKLPPALKEVKAKTAKQFKSQIDPRLLREVQTRGKQWFAKNYVAVPPPRWCYYYLYALERYSSFREAVEGMSEEEPQWYNDGVRFLLEKQAADGTWQHDGGAAVDSAFCVLFLLRSSKKSIERARAFGAGTLIGGRGLPREGTELEVRADRVVVKPLLGPAESLLSSMDDLDYQEDDAALEAMAELPVEDARTLASKHAQKLRQLAGGGSPEARVAAIRTLAKTRNLDYVPLLISALGDRDPKVVREANDGLRRMSRRTSGDALPDRPTDADRQAAIKAWKAWFLAVRPDAQFED